jgi:hypothetical protein
MKLKLTALITLIIPLFANATEVSKSDWFNGMSTVLPTAFCNSNQYFRQCFRVSAQECEETAASATRICLNKYSKEIPETLMQPKDGTHWGTVIGNCAGEAYEITLSQKRINNAKCNDISNWQ